MASKNPRISWQIEEYAYREKGPDWYWALGVIAIAGAAMAVIYHDYLFAVFIVFAAVILGMYAARHPQLVDIAISEDGITIRNAFYPFSKIKGFAVDTHDLGTFLVIESDRTFMPLISIPMPDTIDPEALSELLKTKAPEKKLKEPVAHRVMEHLGF